MPVGVGWPVGVLENTAAVFDDSPDALMAWLGPAISQPCFEVGPEVRQAFLAHDPDAESAFVAGQRDRWFADIYTLARQRLAALGIYDVYGGDYCTVRQEELFFFLPARWRKVRPLGFSDLAGRN